MLVESSPIEVQRQVRSVRLQRRLIGVVPTMGALHDGHRSLIEAARSNVDYVIATIFVNPTQFGPGEDFSRYPRTLDQDLEICRAAGADLVFTPSAAAMYSSSAQTVVKVSSLTTVLEGAHRPGHFDGVSTVVCKLLNITDPDRAYFGQKDFQQQLVIRQMVNDLNFPVEIVTCPIVREPDGLAMSSRNRYLTSSERVVAGEISKTLKLAESMATSAGVAPSMIADEMRKKLASVSGMEISYAVVVDAMTLQDVSQRPDGDAVALIAARVGTTRLIDNAILQFR